MKKPISILLSSLMAFSVLGSTTAFALGEKVAPVESGRYYDLREVENYSYVTMGEDSKAVTFDEAYPIEVHHFIFNTQGIEDKELEAKIKEDYVASISSSNVTVDDISIKYFGTLSDGTMLLDVVGPYAYLDVISASVIGKYLYVQSDSNEYEVYKDGEFSRLYTEYENGHLTGELLDETAELLKLVKFADEQLMLCGDVDLSGQIDIKDATAIQKHLASVDVSDVSSNVSDANGDGNINIEDATAIQKYIVGI